MEQDLNWVDLHLHSHYSWATSRRCTLPAYRHAAQLKGLRVIGTGDIVHPAWLDQLEASLLPADNGLWDLVPEAVAAAEENIPVCCRRPVQFLLSGEVNCVYRHAGAGRRVHHLVFPSSLPKARQLQQRLAPYGRLEADGRPTLKLDSRSLLEILLETDSEAALVPAHIWTPWYSLLGSRSGFDSLEECFGDLRAEIAAVETGLSADPAMLMQADFLQDLAHVSNSDAHSPEKLGREATGLRGPLSRDRLLRMLRGDPDSRPAATIEWPPMLGKYYWDGHRKCGVSQPPAKSANAPVCRVCERPVTRGVLARVEELAKDDCDVKSCNPSPPAVHVVPLPELAAHALGRGTGSKIVQIRRRRLLAALGPELELLMHADPDDVSRVAGESVGRAVLAVRRGELILTPGFDGRFGKWQLPVADESPD